MSPRPRLRILSFLLLAVALVTVAASCGSGSSSAASSGIEPGTGGRATLGDVSITIPAGAVSSTATLDISNDGHAPSSLLGADGAGPEFHATLDQPLSGPAEISVTIQSSESEPNSLFLAYYDEVTSKWIPVAGSVSAGRLTVETEHFSWWKVWKWNWSSWRADLKSALSLQITEWIQGFQNLTTECDKKGKAGAITVDDSAAHGIIQGCVTDDSSSPARVRIINDKAFFLDVTSSNDQSNPKLLASGDSYDIDINTSQQPPLQVTVSISQDAGWRTVAEMVLRLLPAKELLGVKSIAIDSLGSLADALAAIPESKDAFDELMAGHSAAAAEKIYALLTSETTIETITNWAIRFGQDHGISTLSTWTKAGVNTALLGVAAADVIVTWTDFIPNYLLGNGSYVSFGWSGPALSPSPSVDQLAYVSPEGDLWVANVDGTDAHKVVDGPVARPAWSHDGKKLAYIRIDPSYVGNVDAPRAFAGVGVEVVSADGSNRTVVVGLQTVGWPPGATRLIDHHRVVWAADDTALFYHWFSQQGGGGGHPSAIARHDLATGSESEIVCAGIPDPMGCVVVADTESWAVIEDFDVARDGRLAVVENPPPTSDDQYPYRIVMTVSVGGEVQVIGTPNWGGEATVDWSPDSAFVLLGPGFGLRTIPLTRTPYWASDNGLQFEVSDPSHWLGGGPDAGALPRCPCSWSPDGQWLAFHAGSQKTELANGSYSEAIWLVSSAGGQARELFLGTDPSYRPK